MSAPRPSPKPVGAAEFAQALQALAPANRLAVALSGGPDSLALLFLAARWARARKGAEILALTVDHGLRPESSREAREAARMASSLGVPHRILRWKGEKPKTGIQAAARAARYALLAEACRKEKIGALLVAHHLDDQAETFLLRLARGSGVDGLSAMASSRDLLGTPPLRLLRPLLGVPRARLAATLAKAHLVAIADPSNENERYDRVKARKMMSELAALGLDAGRLADTAAHMARARLALEADARTFLAAHAEIASEGYVRLDVSALLKLPEEIALRVLSDCLKTVSGEEYPPRFDALAALDNAIRREVLGGGRTLHGCKIQRDKLGLLIYREPAAALAAPPLRLVSGTGITWDGRFVLEAGARLPRGLEVRALGPEGLARLREARFPFPRLPSALLQGLPAVWKGETLKAVPHLGFGGEMTPVSVRFPGNSGRAIS